MRMTESRLRRLIKSVLLENIMTDFENLVGSDLASRFGQLGSRARGSGGGEALDRVKSEFGAAPSSHDAGWWVSQIRRARKSEDDEKESLLLGALESYLSALEATTSKRKSRQVVMDSEVVTERRTDPEGRQFEIMIPLTHGGSVRCSDRVGGTTWCTASREDNSSYKQYSEESVLFILSPLLTNPKSGEPEAIQIAADADTLRDGELRVEEIMWADQSATAPRLVTTLESYGLSKQDLVGIYKKHAARIDARRRASSDDPRAALFPGGRLNVQGEYRVKGLKPGDVNLSAGTTHVEDVLLDACDLSGLRFPRVRYQYVRFDRCDLSGTEFPLGTIFVECNFFDCNLEGTVFTKCEIQDTNFIRCALVETDFTTSRAYGVEVRGSVEFEPVGVETQVFAPGSQWQER